MPTPKGYRTQHDPKMRVLPKGRYRPTRVAAEGDHVERLRQVFRGLLTMVEHHKMTGVEQYVDCHGTTWNIHDLLRLYRLSQTALTKRQAEAIRLGLVVGLTEAEVSECMGYSRSLPVLMYATEGLRRLDRIGGIGWAA